MVVASALRVDLLLQKSGLERAYRTEGNDRQLGQAQKQPDATSQMVFGQPDDEKLKLDEQNQPKFLAMSPLKYLIGLSNPIKKDIKQYKGEIIPLPAVSLESL